MSAMAIWQARFARAPLKRASSSRPRARMTKWSRSWPRSPRPKPPLPRAGHSHRGRARRDGHNQICSGVTDMIVRDFNKIIEEERNRVVSDAQWSSVRMLLADDGMGFSFHITFLEPGSEHTF